ncbi:bifunctional GNAT family N-acetyltransferase/acetate--CoA ligase family protein [Kutzneria albida]|uniref:Acyl-CoA synthetase (NDP forming type) n=1 Tax=Kutzneria albida DSM 43870 TaxID=1449976 RepID=W5WFJ0_9PSEU|nr:bifunctional GNAT family N-acetyltransferase/acetate--CoA ligase family protein [Kutzneria albida]AHH96934.1 acyl-CoA synthetase (NDP forming type) [Kutzneria albida DSM 43870]
MSPIRALLTDGTVTAIRPLDVRDAAEVRALHEELPERGSYFRFFTAQPMRLDQLVVRMTTADVHRCALGAFMGDSLIGAACYEVVADPFVAEVSVAVRHEVQAHGVGTLLLEHLAETARERGVRQFEAEVLAENSAMLRVLADLGLPVRLDRDGATVRVLVALEQDDRYEQAVASREARADVASMRSLLRPASLVVVGASRRADSVGNAVLRRVLDAGFAGTVAAVNPHASWISNVRCHASVLDLPEVPELVVVCTPASAVPEVLAHCARRGVPAVVIITAGVTGDPPLHRAVLDSVRGSGMRVVGPNCLGIANTDPAVRLDATFAAVRAPRGAVGVVTQSGGAGIVLLDQLRRLSLGVSAFVSTGDKYDVSGNDLLRWFEQDENTELAVLYLESFGNPRKFARLARRLARRKPVLAVRTGTSEVARRAAASHTAATATPATTRDALYCQAGVIAVDTLTELLATIAVLTEQPLPSGPRVVVVSNAGGGGVLAADACAQQGLVLADPSPGLTARLTELLPAQACLGNPVDTSAGVSPSVFAGCVRAAAEDDQVDAVLAITVPTALGDPANSLAESIHGKPVLAVDLTQAEAVRTRGGALPTFADPAVAATALANAVARQRWLSTPEGAVPDLDGIDLRAARALVGAAPEHGWLDPTQTVELLRCFGLPVVDLVAVHTAEEAVDAWRRLGTPVAVKASVYGVLHKTASGGVALNLADESAVRAAVAQLQQRFGTALVELVVQPMAPPGRELLVGIAGDPGFGALVVLGLGGTETDLIADRACRLVPVTDSEATALLTGLRGSPALAEQRLDLDAVHEVLLRVGRLAELLPEVAELDLNPVITHTKGCSIVDARVRLRPVAPGNPLLLRRLNA